MSKARLSRNYAEAMLAGREDAEALVQELGAVLQAVEESDELAQVLSAPVVSDERRAAVVAALAEHAGLQERVASTLQAMVRNNRMDLLPGVFAAAQALVDENLGRTDVRIETGHAWAEAEQKDFENGLAFSNARYTWTVQPDLIAGVRVRVGDRVWDGSIRKQINSIESLLTQ